jgi:hypothetical protein
MVTDVSEVMFTDVSEVMFKDVTVQHIIYNTNRAVWSPFVLRKLLSNTHPGSPLPLPLPPKKNIHNLPKNASPS